MSREKKLTLYLSTAILIAYLFFVLWIIDNQLIRLNESFLIGVFTTIFIEVWFYIVSSL